MSNPWLDIPLADYEGHMRSAGVGQLAVLSELFQSVLSRLNPESVAVLGIAGGNGLEHIDCSVTKRIVGIDFNRHYLEEAGRRFGDLPGLELVCFDLSKEGLRLPPVAMVHAALVFEHVDTRNALENALALVSPLGKLSVVLQLPGTIEQDVASTAYLSMQALKKGFALIGTGGFSRLLESRGFLLLEQETRSVPGGKALWLGVYARA